MSNLYTTIGASAGSLVGQLASQNQYLNQQYNQYISNIEYRQFPRSPGQISRWDENPMINKPKEKKTMIKMLTGWIDENKNVIFTVIMVALIDKYMFDGAFRNRIKNIVDNFLAKQEKPTNA